MIEIVINGESHELPDGATVAEAAAAVGIDADTRGVAVAVDGEVVARSQLAEIDLSDGQRVEVVAAIGGGSR